MGYRMVPVSTRTDVGERLATFRAFGDHARWFQPIKTVGFRRNNSLGFDWWAVQRTETRVACGALGRGRWQTEQRWVGEVMDVSLQMLF